jgi:hypothetical protein
MKRLHILISLMACSVQTFAQTPTITRTNVEAAFTNSARTERQFTITPTTVNLGMPSGSPQTFNFATVPGTTTRLDTARTLYIPPTGQVGSTSFPTATTAGKLIDSSGGQVITTVQYFRIQDNGAFFLGFAQRIQQGTSDSTSIFIYNPAALFLPLPLTVGTNRTSSDTLDVPPIRRVTLRSFIGDGYGTLSLPNGTMVSAIRVITERTELSFFGGMLFSRVKNRDVEYYGTDLSFAAFDRVDTLYTSGSTTVREFEYNVRTGSTGVRSDGESLPAQLALHQNFPNPFNPTTNLEFRISDFGFVSLKVFDVLGREVATLIYEMMPAGKYEATWNAANFPSGVYMIRLSAGEKSATRKVVLMK